MDDLPVPKVPWQEYHGKTNAKYNIILATGIISFVSSIYVVSTRVNMSITYTQIVRRYTPFFYFSYRKIVSSMLSLRHTLLKMNKSEWM